MRSGVLNSACLLALLAGICILNAQGLSLQAQEVSRFAFTSHDMGYARAPAIQYPYVYIPNSYGFQVCVWDSTADSFTEIANYGVPGWTTELLLWQDYLFLAVRYNTETLFGPDSGTLFRVDVTDPWHPQSAGMIGSGADYLLYYNLRVANGVLLAAKETSAGMQSLVCIDPSSLEITHQYPGHYRFEVVADDVVISRPMNASPFSLFSVDPASGLTPLGTVTLPHYEVNTFPRFATLGPNLVGSQCGSGMYLWQLGDILNWSQLSFIEHEFDTNGVLCNGYLVFGNYEDETSRFYVYEIGNPAQPILLNNIPYPPGLENPPAMDKLVAYGDYLFHCCHVYGCLCLKMADAGALSLASECYEYPEPHGHGTKSGNYILQPFYYRGVTCFDVSDPQNPEYAFTLFPDRSVYVWVRGNYLWTRMTPVGVFDMWDTEAIYDISDLQDPQPIFSIPFNIQTGLFFNDGEPDCFYLWDGNARSIAKYAIAGGQASLLFTYPYGVALQNPSFVNGILYMASLSSVAGMYDLYSFAGFPENAPQPPNVLSGFIPGPGWVYPCGNYLYIRDIGNGSPTCIFHNEVSTFTVANDIFGFPFQDFVCIGRGNGVSFYDTSGFPSGFVAEDYFLPQYSYSSKLEWDANYFYLFSQDNISIYSFQVTGADDPVSPALSGFYCSPNPFRASTTLKITLPESGPVELAIYNVKGQKIRTLCSGRAAAGENSWQWDGRDGAGKLACAGIYVARLVTARGSSAKKLSLLK